MSNDWRIHCNDCDEHAGFEINHGSEELARLLARRNELAAVGHVEGLVIEVWGSNYPLPAWFKRHEGHKIVVRSEYGYDFEDCAQYASCSCCKARFVCRLPKGHDGDHAPRRDE